jgi:hypothetical protein
MIEKGEAMKKETKSIKKTAKTAFKSKSLVKKTVVKKTAAPQKAISPKKTPIKPKKTEVLPVSNQTDAFRQPQTQLSHRRPLLIIPK